MPRLTADQWAIIRAEREAGASFGDLAARFGVSKAAVSKASKREGWGDGSDVGEIIRRKVTEKVTGVVTAETARHKAEIIDAAAEKGAEVIRLQRDDWERHRNHFGSVPADLDAGKLAKLSAEMLAIRQKAERIAWGLDESESKPDITIQWAGLAVQNHA